jgi:transcriptional regulator with XRE-family HTH domain
MNYRCNLKNITDVIFILFTFVIPINYRMKERLYEFLRRENKSSAQLAEEIGVQASGISHILSGRNNPSLDFILKMLEKYKFLSTDWLLFGRGSMYKEAKMQTLFDFEPVNPGDGNERIASQELRRQAIESQAGKEHKSSDKSDKATVDAPSEVVRIIWFYENNSFEEFYPRR